MPRITLDLSEARSFEPTEPGPYPMVVDSIDGPSKSKPSEKNPNGVNGVTVTFKFQDPELDRKCGSVIRWYGIEGKSSGFFREFWKAATGEDIAIGEVLDIDTDDAIGRPVTVEIENEEYEHKLQNRAAKVTAEN